MTYNQSGPSPYQSSSHLHSQPIQSHYAQHQPEYSPKHKEHLSTLGQNVVKSDNQRSIDVFSQFMQINIIIASVCAFLSLFVLGWSGLYVAATLSICIASFLYSTWMVKWMLARDDSTAEMRRISDAIRSGSEGFLSVQYTTIAQFAVIVSVVLFFIYMLRPVPPGTNLSQTTLAFLTSLSFLIGAFCSGLAGYVGVWISVRVNLRVAVASSNFNYNDALRLAFRGGAVSSVVSASMCISGISLLYLFCHIVFVSWSNMPAEQVPMLLAGYGFGASFVALFMQLGGGIYTKAADVGADLVGKVEQDIPEDDPRNPAVIADLVGDNVGDCAGSMADVFESIAAEMIGTMILGATLAHEAKVESPIAFIFFPLIVHAFDLVVSGIGIYTVRSDSDAEDPLDSMKRGYVISMCLAIVGFVTTCRIMLVTAVAPDAWWHFALCGVVGIITSYLLLLITQFYTDYQHSPTQRIANASKTGHATNIIAGVAVGMESTAMPIIVISTALLISFNLGATSGLPSVAAGVFGTAVATMGMLCTAVFILSMNNFGPIADNAGGIVEMSGQSEQVRTITDRLDSVGNVTKAAAKGYAVGGSALACFVLFQAFLDEVNTFTVVEFTQINLAQVEVVVGGLLGIMMIFLFTGWAISAVGCTAEKVVWEVRRQFKEKPGIMDGSELPDYNACVSIVTRAALREMIRPATLALAAPVSIGFLFKFIGELTGRYMLGIEVVGSFMLFGTLTGLLMAIFLDNSGGSWDNAKKYIEANGQKGSEAHKASVTGDTVGDPFKDTAGPALHVIITTMSTTILVLGPLFIGTQPRF